MPASPIPRAALRKLKITPHVARSDDLTKTGKRRTSIVSDAVATSTGYAMSQTRRNHKKPMRKHGPEDKLRFFSRLLDYTG